jgi:hypothetical protein
LKNEKENKFIFKFKRKRRKCDQLEAFEEFFTFNKKELVRLKKRFGINLNEKVIKRRDKSLVSSLKGADHQLLYSNTFEVKKKKGKSKKVIGNLLSVGKEFETSLKEEKLFNLKFSLNRLKRKAMVIAENGKMLLLNKHDNLFWYVVDNVYNVIQNLEEEFHNVRDCTSVVSFLMYTKMVLLSEGGRNIQFCYSLSSEGEGMSPSGHGYVFINRNSQEVHCEKEIYWRNILASLTEEDNFEAGVM